MLYPMSSPPAGGLLGSSFEAAADAHETLVSTASWLAHSAETSTDDANIATANHALVPPSAPVSTSGSASVSTTVMVANNLEDHLIHAPLSATERGLIALEKIFRRAGDERMVEFLQAHEAHDRRISSNSSLPPPRAAPPPSSSSPSIKAEVDDWAVGCHPHVVALINGLLEALDSIATTPSPSAGGDVGVYPRVTLNDVDSALGKLVQVSPAPPLPAKHTTPIY